MSAALVLALDTSFGPAGVALATRDGTLLASRCVIDAAGRQTEVLPTLVDEVFRETSARYADVARVVLTSGPGAFTGIRIGLAFAKGIKVATGAEVLGVSTLECLVMQAFVRTSAHHVAAVIDARREEVYACGFSRDGSCWLKPCVTGVASLNALLRSRAPGALVVTGSGQAFVDAEAATWLAPNIERVDIEALVLRGAGLAAANYPAVPAYLREPDARLPA